MQPRTLHLSDHTNAKHLVWILFAISFGHAGHHNTYTASPQLEIYFKCLSQVHNDALPPRESNRELATFRSLPQRSTK